MKEKIVALVPAAGTGTRLGDALPKQYLDVNGYPMIYHALAVLCRIARIAKIGVVLSPDDGHWQGLIADAEAGRLLGTRVTTWPVGGPSRSKSVLNGLKAMTGEMHADDWVMVHDAARPCIRAELIEQFIDELEADPVGGLLALPLADTLKRDDGNLRVDRTLDREGIWRAQTPQMFRYGMLVSALERLPGATDESQAIESLGHQPKLVMGDSANLKVTYAPDLKLARILLREEIS
ncbi:MAG: 2-C-methyl-D-erythritol 4-phosphate cytidylyltransferase [Betaproteobacteria bacterium]